MKLRIEFEITNESFGHSQWEKLREMKRIVMEAYDVLHEHSRAGMYLDQLRRPWELTDNCGNTVGHVSITD